MLDVLRVGLLRPRPQCHQPENWLVDQSEWSLLARPLGAPLFGALKSHVVHDENLLGGPSDRVAVETFAAAPAKASLALVAPETVVFRCQPRPSGVPQVRGRFCLGPRRVTFDLAVTDPRWEKKILQAGRMTLQQGEQPFLLTISLGEPYRGFCYKLIAAVIPLPPELARHVAHGC